MIAESTSTDERASAAHRPPSRILRKAVERLSREQLALALVAAREGRLDDVDALLGEANRPPAAETLTCRRCRHEWTAATRPARCPSCARPRWWAPGPLGR